MTTKPRSRRLPLLAVGVLLAALALAKLSTVAVPNPFSGAMPPISVDGVFPFQQGWKLELVAEYVSQATWCEARPRAFGLFAQTDTAVPRVARVTYSVPSADSNLFRYSLPANALTGPCHWELARIFPRVTDAKGIGVVIVREKEDTGLGNLSRVCNGDDSPYCEHPTDAQTPTIKINYNR